MLNRLLHCFRAPPQSQSSTAPSRQKVGEKPAANAASSTEEALLSVPYLGLPLYKYTPAEFTQKREQNRLSRERPIERAANGVTVLALAEAIGRQLEHRYRAKEDLTGPVLLSWEPALDGMDPEHQRTFAHDYFLPWGLHQDAEKAQNLLRPKFEAAARHHGWQVDHVELTKIPADHFTLNRTADGTILSPAEKLEVQLSAPGYGR